MFDFARAPLLKMWASAVNFLTGRLSSPFVGQKLAQLAFLVLTIGTLWTLTLTPVDDYPRRYIISGLTAQNRNPDGYRILATTLIAVALIMVPLPGFLARQHPGPPWKRTLGWVTFMAGLGGLALVGLERGFFPALGSWWRHAHLVWTFLAFGGWWFGTMWFLIGIPRNADARPGRATEYFCHGFMVFGALAYLALEGFRSNAFGWSPTFPSSLSWLGSFTFWQWGMVFCLFVLSLIVARRAGDLAEAKGSRLPD